MHANMSPKDLLLVIPILILSSPSSAFNITEILADYPDFTSFNDLLSRTRLNDSINTRQTITVLVVNNGAISAISSKPLDSIKKLLSLHVVLDYYDEAKLRKLTNGTTLLTTLFQTSGKAAAQQGFLNATILKNGDVAIGSAVKGATLDSKLVKSVVARPYNISVLEISNPVIPPGVDGAASPPTPLPSPPPAPAPKTKPVKAPAPAPDGPAADADSPPAASPAAVVDGPDASPAADVGSPDASPAADVDSPAASPEADADESSAGTATVCMGAIVLSGLMVFNIASL